MLQYFGGKEGDLRPWIVWLEDFFAQNEFTDLEKMNLAQFTIDGEASVWFQRRQSLFPFSSWEAMKEELLLEFGDKDDPEKIRLILENERSWKELKSWAKIQERNAKESSIHQTEAIQKNKNVLETELIEDQKEIMVPDSFSATEPCETESTGELLVPTIGHDEESSFPTVELLPSPRQAETSKMIAKMGSPDSIQNVESRPEQAMMISSEDLSEKEEKSIGQNYFISQKEMLQNQVSLSYLEPTLTFCNNSLNVLEELPTTTVSKNRLQSQYSSAGITGKHELQRSMGTMMRFYAYQMFEEMILKEHSFQHKRKRIKFFNPWRFKFKKRSRTRNLIQEKLWFNAIVEANDNGFNWEHAISEIFELFCYLMWYNEDLAIAAFTDWWQFERKLIARFAEFRPCFRPTVVRPKVVLKTELIHVSDLSWATDLLETNVSVKKQSIRENSSMETDLIQETKLGCEIESIASSDQETESTQESKDSQLDTELIQQVVAEILNLILADSHSGFGFDGPFIQEEEHFYVIHSESNWFDIRPWFKKQLTRRRHKTFTKTWRFKFKQQLEKMKKSQMLGGQFWVADESWEDVAIHGVLIPSLDAQWVSQEDMTVMFNQMLIGCRIWLTSFIKYELEVVFKTAKWQPNLGCMLYGFERWVREGDITTAFFDLSTSCPTQIHDVTELGLRLIIVVRQSRRSQDKTYLLTNSTCELNTRVKDRERLSNGTDFFISVEAPISFLAGDRGQKLFQTSTDIILQGLVMSQQKTTPKSSKLKFKNKFRLDEKLQEIRLLQLSFFKENGAEMILCLLLQHLRIRTPTCWILVCVMMTWSSKGNAKEVFHGDEKMTITCMKMFAFRVCITQRCSELHGFYKWNNLGVAKIWITKTKVTFMEGKIYAVTFNTSFSKTAPERLWETESLLVTKIWRKQKQIEIVKVWWLLQRNGIVILSLQNVEMSQTSIVITKFYEAYEVNDILSQQVQLKWVQRKIQHQWSFCHRGVSGLIFGIINTEIDAGPWKPVVYEQSIQSRTIQEWYTRVIVVEIDVWPSLYHCSLRTSCLSEGGNDKVRVLEAADLAIEGEDHSEKIAK